MLNKYYLEAVEEYENKYFKEESHSWQQIINQLMTELVDKYKEVKNE